MILIELINQYVNICRGSFCGKNKDRTLLNWWINQFLEDDESLEA
jgi:hypothetical protein